MSGPTRDGAPEGADAKREAASPGPAPFQASAAPPPRAPRWLLLGAVALVGGGAVFAARALMKGTPPPASTAKPSVTPPTPVAVPEGETVKIPGGAFSMGSNEGDPDEKPVTQVTVSAFELDATEVTTAAYKKCVAAGKCTEPDTGMYCNWRKEGRERHPVNCVDLEQATAYCAFVGRRLPTEEEWEFAARGTDGRGYPWGSAPPGGQLCWNGEGSDLGKGERQGTCPVASYPAGRSPFGAFDMGGNVWEWTANAHCPYDHRGCTAPTRVIRGGAWNNVLPRYVRAQDRAEEAAGSRRDNVGFRCARSPSAPG